MELPYLEHTLHRIYIISSSSWCYLRLISHVPFSFLFIYSIFICVFCQNNLASPQCTSGPINKGLDWWVHGPLHYCVSRGRLSSPCTRPSPYISSLVILFVCLSIWLWRLSFSAQPWVFSLHYYKASWMPVRYNEKYITLLLPPIHNTFCYYRCI
jgi:hypothetical protein